MSIYLQGKSADIFGVYAGMDEVAAVYSGDVQVWPDIADGDNYIVVEPPAVGSEEYVYWRHALDAVSGGEINNSRYLKFNVNDKDYYINKAPSGGEVVIMEGGVIKLSKKQANELKGIVGAALNIVAVVPQREGGWKSVEIEKEIQVCSWFLPLLNGSYFKASLVSFISINQSVKFYIEDVVSYPSGTVFAIDYSKTFTRSGKNNVTASSPTKDYNMPLSDNSFSVRFKRNGGSGGSPPYLISNKGITVVYPAFDREFNLTVLKGI